MQVVVPKGIEEVPISMEIIRPGMIDNKGELLILNKLSTKVLVSLLWIGQVSIRGGSGFSYGAGSRVLLLWNGVPLLSGDAGDAKWNSIPMEQVLANRNFERCIFCFYTEVVL